MVQYPAVIEGDRRAYGVVIPDMPGSCCAMGATVDEALANSEHALADFVGLLREQGEAVPTPRALLLSPARLRQPGGVAGTARPTRSFLTS